MRISELREEGTGGIESEFDLGDARVEVGQRIGIGEGHGWVNNSQ